MRYMPSALTWYLAAATLMMGIHLPRLSHLAMLRSKRYCLARRCTRCFHTWTARRAFATLALSSATVGAVVPAVAAGDGVAAGSVVVRPASTVTAAVSAASAAFRRRFEWRRASLAERSLPLREAASAFCGTAAAASAVATTMMIATMAIQLLLRLTTSFRRDFPAGSGHSDLCQGAFGAETALSPHANAA